MSLRSNCWNLEEYAQQLPAPSYPVPFDVNKHSPHSLNLMASSQDHQLHFILVPFMAQGHTIPMVDIARLIAQRGVLVTIVTTPLNLLRFKTITDRAIQSGLPIQLLKLHFPCIEVGLPEGCENFDTIPSRDAVKEFFTATTMLQLPLEESLREITPAPSCIISDFCLPWTSETAQRFGIPRIIFHGFSCFSLLCCHNFDKYKVGESGGSLSESLVIPGLPDCVEITKSCLPGTLHNSSGSMKVLHNQIKEAESTAYGVVVNSFYNLEPTYVQEYQNVKQNKVWCIGPVSLCNKEMLDKLERGNKASIDENRCFKWLDSREPNSVVYVCLGSLCRLKPEQFMEIGLGLEASHLPFIWVVNSSDRYKELHRWISEEAFEERTKDRCLILRGWAPQVLILSHPAVGGFMTHCGWNSTLEGVSAGVPLIAWPMFAEQFLNEKLIVQVLEIGVEVGAKEPVPWGEEDKIGVTVKREQVQRAMNKLMDDSSEGQERRKRARELGNWAKQAMEEEGSSHLSLTHLIQDIKQQVNSKASMHILNNAYDK